MKKWIFAIITGVVSLVICATLIALIFGNASFIPLIVGAGVSYYAGQYVFKHFKDQENNVI